MAQRSSIERPYRIVLVMTVFLLAGGIWWLRSSGVAEPPGASDTVDHTPTAAPTVPGQGVPMPTSMITAVPGQGVPVPTGTTAADAHVLRVQIPTYSDDLDPHHMSFSYEIAIAGQLYEGLTRLNENLEIGPAAAERWEFNGDLTTITFTLKPDLKYSDGSPLTARDFEYAVRRTLSPEVAGFYQYLLFDIVGAAEVAATPADDQQALAAAYKNLGVRVIDERTIAFDLLQPAPYFPSIASLWVFYPAKQELIEAGGQRWYDDPQNLVGNGPFVLAGVEQFDRLIFEPNPNYQGGQPKLDRLEYVFISDPAAALEAFNQGHLHIVQPDRDLLSTMVHDPYLSPQLLAYPGTATTTIAFNLTQAPFTDPKVREAFAYAFDRETYCSVVRTHECIPTLSWVPPGMMGFYEEDRFGFDPERARQALAESSYGSAAALPPITYSFGSNNPANHIRAEGIAENYRKHLGVEIALQPVNTDVLLSRREDSATFPQMTMSGHSADYPDAHTWLSVNWTCASEPARQVGYCNPALDALVSQADTSSNQAERERLYIEAGKLLVADHPGVFLHNLANVFLVSPKVIGYSITASDSEWPGQWVSPTTIDVLP